MPPIATLPLTCAPQRSLKSDAERFSVPNAPGPSKAITGTARKVIRAQAPFSRPATICSPISPKYWIAATTRLTAVAIAAQPAIEPKRERAAASPSPTVASRPWKIASAVAASPTEKKRPMRLVR